MMELPSGFPRGYRSRMDRRISQGGPVTLPRGPLVQFAAAAFVCDRSVSSCSQIRHLHLKGNSEEDYEGRGAISGKFPRQIAITKSTGRCPGSSAWGNADSWVVQGGENPSCAAGPYALDGTHPQLHPALRGSTPPFRISVGVSLTVRPLVRSSGIRARQQWTRE